MKKLFFIIAALLLFAVLEVLIITNVCIAETINLQHDMAGVPQYCAISDYDQLPRVCLLGYSCKNDTDYHLRRFLQPQVIGALQKAKYPQSEINDLLPTYSYGWYLVRAVKLKKNPYKVSGR